MTKEQYEEEAAFIANEGLGYYLEYYGAHSQDPELQKLYDEGAEALKKITAYFSGKGVELGDY
jgi:hypothetical protein